jgi:hypothetical protein
MKLRVLGTGVAMAASLTGVAVLASPAASYAASCYTGCHTSTPPKTAGGAPTSTDPASGITTTSAHALAFTGANVVLPTGIGAGAVIVGGTLMMVGRRRRLRTVA